MTEHTPCKVCGNPTLTEMHALCAIEKVNELTSLLRRWQNWNYGADGDMGLGADTARALKEADGRSGK